MQIRTLVLALATTLAASTAHAALTAVTSFGSNPGGLAMYEYVPAGLTAGRPIVVVLHGCTQTAANMEAAGWNAIADQYKFTVVYAEQTTTNNPVRCFNWAGEYGDPANLVRGQGENQSIIQMIDKAISTHASDASKVYVVGFSAGAAFASVLAATWPERFAGVAIMSGIPYRCATTVNGAYSCQSPGVSKTPAEWGDLVRGSHAGPYPRVQIWHGASDSTVVPMNSDELVKQWTNAMGIDSTADQTETVNGATRNAYMSGSTIMLETYRVPGMGHAVAAGTDAVGACPTTVGSYFANKGICATVRAAMFFGLATGGTGPGPGPSGTDTVKPSVVITSPSDGDEVTGALTIVVAATDDVAIDHVSLSIDGAAIGEVVDAPYQFAWTASGGGEHTIVATAVDASSNEATTEITVTVPGPGGGSGSNGNNPANGELPGCTLDIGGHHRGGTSAILLALSVVLALRRRRR